MKNRDSAAAFINAWNELLGMETPPHHLEMTRFFVKTIFEKSSPRSEGCPKGGVVFNRGLMMCFRHSGKSSVVGIMAAWFLTIKPQARVLILSAEQTLSSRMVSHIKNIIENHPACKDMVPMVKKEWASHRITIERPVGPREPSVICQGVHGNITGMRADLIICDDVEVPNTSNTAQKRAQLRERLRELDFILSPGGAMLYLGTPHSADTIYQVQ
ncbi:MAG: phage terminase large subunit [Rickettsiales bacterium]|nr:phage terminase large subunit [Rickettsiales bacterium]